MQFLKNKKKLIFIAFSNILLIIFILVTADYCLYKQCCKNDSLSSFRKYYPVPSYLQYYNSAQVKDFSEITQNDFNFYFRPAYTNPQNKKAIVFFGCSFAYGDGLKDKQKFHYKIFNQTSGYDTYNFAVCGSGVQYMFYSLNNLKVLDYVPKPVEYVIYTYIPEQNYRVRKYYNDVITQKNIGLTAAKKNGKVVIEHRIFPKFFYKTFIFKKFFEIKLHYLFKDKALFRKQNNELNYLLFRESKKIINSYYPNAKTVVLVYHNDTDECYDKELFEKLEQDGFIILDTIKLTGKTFTQAERIDDGFHPNENAWNILTPKIITALNLQKK